MKNILITGLTGFAGPHLANYLIKCIPEHDLKIYGLVRASNGRENDIRDVVPDSVFSQIEWVQGDLDNYDSLKQIFAKITFDEIYHLGAQSHPPTSFTQPRNTFVTNSLGTINLVDLVENYCPECKFMNCSTSEVYGAVPEEEQPITEEYPINPINPYGASKAAGDIYVTERAKSKGLKLFNTRAFSHTGPRRGFRFSISGDAYQIIRIKKGLQRSVIAVGTLSSKRVVMDVRDCVRAYAMLMELFTPGESYNVGGDEDSIDTIGGFLGLMLDFADLRGKVAFEVNPNFVRKIDIPVQIPDSTKCRELTGWKPMICMAQTLTDLLGYWDTKIKE